MARHVFTLCSIALVLFLTGGVALVKGGQPVMWSEMPGKVSGEATSEWIAPFVLKTEIQVGERHSTTVRWYKEDGTILRELSGSLEARRSYISEYTKGGGCLYHGVNEDWTLTLPNKSAPGESGTLLGCVGEVFAHQYHPERGLIAVDVYRSGKLAGTVGPFNQYEGSGAHLCRDGRVAFMAVGKINAVQLVVAGTDGKVQYQAEIPDPHDDTFVVGPGTTGFLVQPTVPGKGRQKYEFRKATGELVRTIDLGLNPDCLLWLPGTARVLFCHIKPNSADHQLTLLDVGTGKTVWAIDTPTRSHPLGYTPYAAFVEVGDYLLWSTKEPRGKNQPSLFQRIAYAIDLRTGATAARWCDNRFAQDGGDTGYFSQLGDRLFLVCKDKFAEIKWQEIVGSKNGWEWLGKRD